MNLLKTYILYKLYKRFIQKKPKFKNPSIHTPNPNKKGFRNITLKDKYQFQWNGPDFKKVFPTK